MEAKHTLRHFSGLPRVQVLNAIISVLGLGPLLEGSESITVQPNEFQLGLHTVPSINYFLKFLSP